MSTEKSLSPKLSDIRDDADGEKPRRASNKKRASPRSSDAKREALVRGLAKSTNAPSHIDEHDPVVSSNATGVAVVLDPLDGAVEEKPVRVGAIAFGTTSYELFDNGVVETHPGCRWWSHGNRPVDFVRGQLNDILSIGPIPAVTGVNIIIGPADTGKTPVLEFVGQTANVEVVRAGEPFPGYIRETDVLAGVMIANTDPVMCIDSLKNITGRLAGGLMASGLSREFFMTISDMSSYFAERQQAVFIVVNISNNDEQVRSLAIEALASNAGAVWDIDSAGVITWFARSSAGKRRRRGRAQITWGGDGIVKELRSLDGFNATRQRPPVTEFVGSAPIQTNLQSALGKIARRTADVNNEENN